MDDLIRERPAVKWRKNHAEDQPDQLAVEEPLEIRLGGRKFTITMRTPGHDEELISGFLLAEGFIANCREISEIRHVPDAKGAPEPNTLDVILAVPATELSERLKRNFAVSSSCGVCGKASIEALERRIVPLNSNIRVSGEMILELPRMMREAQAVFSATGGLHAAALFQLLPDPGARSLPKLSVLREDVGRHNAVDKVIGYALQHDLLPLRNWIMMVSGRLSFEIVQKAAAAGIPILCAVSAPSSLAVDLADDLGMTLVGFLRPPDFNVYAHQERVGPKSLSSPIQTGSRGG